MCGKENMRKNAKNWHSNCSIKRAESMTSNVQFNRRILEMEEVYIVSGVRTAIGKYGGSLKNVPAHTLAAEVIKEAVKRAGIEKDIINEVIPVSYTHLTLPTICSV